MSTKKELKQQYKELKTPMGVMMIKNNVSNNFFIDINKDVKSYINRHRFQLKMGVHRLKDMQNEWNQYGEEAFSFEVLELLPYDEKEERTDYMEELEIMKIIWIEKLSENGTVELYKK